MNRERGFSLVELLTVVALVGIASAIAVPNILSQLPKWHANGSTRDVMSKLMVARLKAIQNNKEYAVLFTLGDTDSYKLLKKSGGNWLDEGATTAAPTDVTMELGGGAPCSNNRVEFNPSGTAGCSPVWVKTKDDAYKRKISIDSNTGRISVKFCEKEAC